MLEVKVQCDCGQRYKFEVEPANGRMPFTVNCPICGLDGTAKANEVLSLGAAPQAVRVPVAAVRVPIAAAAPAPSPIATATGEPRTFRISGLPPSLATARPVAEAPKVASTRSSGRPQPLAATAPAAGAKKPSFALGFLGAVIGAVVGSLVYFLIFNYTGLRLKLLAIGVGYLTGLGAELLGRKEGSKELGVIAAVFTLVGVIGAQYLVARNWWNEGSSARAHQSGYEAAVAEAKKVVAAVPTGSDQEIRTYLAKEEADPGEKPDTQSITDEEVKDFKDTTLKEMQNLASGQTTKEAFDKQRQVEEAKDKAEALSEEGTFKAVFLLLLLSKVNLFSLAAGAGLAFKVCSNA
jgi:hypothetical protein